MLALDGTGSGSLGMSRNTACVIVGNQVALATRGSSVPWASKPGSLSVREVRLVNILFDVGLPSVSHLCLLIRWL